MSARFGEDYSTGKDAAPMVGDYIVGHRIGQGSFAIVYKGQHKIKKTPVAVKSVLRSKLTRKLLENLESEIAILKGIRHNHIVELVDCKNTDSHIHLIMEFCSLGDLSAFIKRNKGSSTRGLPEYVARHFLKQLASALEFLRSQNLIHRDIKPQNLLLLPPPNATSLPGRTPMIGLPDLPTLKIADFGFARSLPSHSLAETLCGSPLYMAPEILRYERYDAKADLWSVGAVLYEMVTGRPPFRAQNHVELLRKIEKSNNKIKFPGDPPSPLAYDSFDGHASPPPSTASPVSEDMKDVIRHLLKRNPVERISFEEFFLHRAVTAELGSSPHGSGAGAALPAQDDPLPLVLPQPTRTTSTPATRHDYELPPFAQQAPANARPTRSDARRTTAPILMQEQPVGFAAAQYDRVEIEGIRRPLPPLQQQGVVSRNAVGMQKENRHNARPHTEPLYRASDDAGRPLPRRLRANSFDISSPPHSILIQHTSGAAQLAADEAEQREREIPGLPKRRGSVGGTGAESLRGFNNRGIEESTPEDDVFFEREYVVVEKKVIEMNELADQFAASPQNNMVVRHTNSRTRIPFSASTSPSSPPVIRPPSPISPFFQGITPPPPSAQNQFVYPSSQSSASYYYGTTPPPFANSGSPTGQQQERPWGSPTTSAGSGGSALAKAISISKRLLGGTGTGNSPPSWSDKYLSNRRGSSGSTSSGNAVVVFRAGGDDPEEDAAIKTIEDAAHKAYAVEQLAQSKFDMIAPPPPAAPDPLPSQADTTPQDKARIAEEAFVLYLKTLALLQSGMDVAKEHWEKQRAGLTASSPAKVASSRLNDAVQWIRDRFNECLEKAEYVKSKCPPEEKDYNNQLTVKLIYDRALEMSRTAAVNELRGADMPGCEHAYQTSIWMLKAILDVQLQGEDDEAMDDEDQRVVNKFISSITNRLNALRRKAELAVTAVSGSPSSLG